MTNGREFEFKTGSFEFKLRITGLPVVPIFTAGQLQQQQQSVYTMGKRRDERRAQNAIDGKGIGSGNASDFLKDMGSTLVGEFLPAVLPGVGAVAGLAATGAAAYGAYNAYSGSSSKKKTAARPGQASYNTGTSYAPTNVDNANKSWFDSASDMASAATGIDMPGGTSSRALPDFSQALNQPPPYDPLQQSRDVVMENNVQTAPPAMNPQYVQPSTQSTFTQSQYTPSQATGQSFGTTTTATTATGGCNCNCQGKVDNRQQLVCANGMTVRCPYSCQEKCAYRAQKAASSASCTNCPCKKTYKKTYRKTYKKKSTPRKRSYKSSYY